MNRRSTKNRSMKRNESRESKNLGSERDDLESEGEDNFDNRAQKAKSGGNKKPPLDPNRKSRGSKN